MSIAVGIIIVWLLLSVIGTIVTVRLLRRIWRERKQTPTATKWLAGVVAVGGMLGALGTLLGFIRMMRPVGGESVDPSQKARVLAEGISEAMNWTGFALVTWLPSLIAAFVLTRALGRPAR